MSQSIERTADQLPVVFLRSAGGKSKIRSNLFEILLFTSGINLPFDQRIQKANTHSNAQSSRPLYLSFAQWNMNGSARPKLRETFDGCD
jgi:hypothetical protein